MKVLISHIRDERPLAELLAEWLEREFPGQFDAELNSDLDTLASGQAWLEAIAPLYEMNTMLIILCSPLSINRPWSTFEAGKLDGNRVPLLLICHSGLSERQLPVQLAECDALEVNEEDFEGRFMLMVSHKAHLDTVPVIDELLFRDQLNKALRRLEANELTSQQRPLPKELLDEEGLEILTTLAGSAGGSLSAGQLVERLKLPEQVVDTHMRRLLQRGLVSDMVYRDGPRAFTISQKGREFMQSVSLL